MKQKPRAMLVSLAPLSIFALVGAIAPAAHTDVESTRGDVVLLSAVKRSLDRVDRLTIEAGGLGRAALACVLGR